MEYTNEITIEQPRSLVVELFDDPENMKHWQEGLLELEHVSGDLGQPGAILDELNETAAELVAETQ